MVKVGVDMVVSNSARGERGPRDKRDRYMYI
jgi:hypothetical protein